MYPTVWKTLHPMGWDDRHERGRLEFDGDMGRGASIRKNWSRWTVRTIFRSGQWSERKGFLLRERSDSWRCQEAILKTLKKEQTTVKDIIGQYWIRFYSSPAGLRWLVGHWFYRNLFLKVPMTYAVSFYCLALMIAFPPHSFIVRGLKAVGILFAFPLSSIFSSNGEAIVHFRVIRITKYGSHHAVYRAKANDACIGHFPYDITTTQRTQTGSKVLDFEADQNSCMIAMMMSISFCDLSDLHRELDRSWRPRLQGVDFKMEVFCTGWRAWCRSCALFVAAVRRANDLALAIKS